MLKCNLIKVWRVVCEDSFILEDIEPNIPINLTICPKTQIDEEQTKVRVTVLNCKIYNLSSTFFANLILMINKELTLLQPNGQRVKLEYSFQKSFPNLKFNNCCLDLLRPENIKKLQGHIYCLEAEDEIQLLPERNSFSEILRIRATIKVGYEDQIEIPRCPPKTQCPKIPCQLAVALGKIKSQLGNQEFKKKLIKEMEKIYELLKNCKILQALLVLQSIIQQVQLKLSLEPKNRLPLQLVLADLLLAEDALLKYL